MTTSEILIADYKTNHAPPRDLAGVPPAYRQQLALYRALLHASVSRQGCARGAGLDRNA